jgi:hypothetical protein
VLWSLWWYDKYRWRHHRLALTCFFLSFFPSSFFSRLLGIVLAYRNIKMSFIWFLYHIWSSFFLLQFISFWIFLLIFFHFSL